MNDKEGNSKSKIKENPLCMSTDLILGHEKKCILVIIFFTLSTILSQFHLSEISSSAPASQKKIWIVHLLGYNSILGQINGLQKCSLFDIRDRSPPQCKQQKW